MSTDQAASLANQFPTPQLINVFDDDDSVEPVQKLPKDKSSERNNAAAPGCEVIDNAARCTTRLAQLVNNQKFSDVVLVVGEKKYYAHRLLLANASEVFEQMLTSSIWVENKQPLLALEEHDNCINVFSDFLRYIYTGYVALNPDSVLGLLVLADKYNISDLKSCCSEYMKKNLVALPDQSHVIVWYQYSLACNLLALERACFNYILLNMDVIMQASDWPCLDKANLEAILRRSDMVVSSEYAVLNACIRWLSDESRRDKIEDNLKDLVPLLRFPMMLPEHLYEFESSQFERDHHAVFQTYLLAAYRDHALSLKGKSAVSIAPSSPLTPPSTESKQIPRWQYEYRNYTDENYGIYVDVTRSAYKTCPRVSSKVEKALSLPVSVCNAMPDRHCKLKVTFYPQGYYTTSLWNGQLNLAKSTDLTRMVVAHRGGTELMRAGISVVVFAESESGLGYVEQALNTEHTFEVYGQLEMENVIDVKKLQAENSRYLVNHGSVSVRVFIRPFGFYLHALPTFY